MAGPGHISHFKGRIRGDIDLLTPSGLLKLIESTEVTF